MTEQEIREKVRQKIEDILFCPPSTKWGLCRNPGEVAYTKSKQILSIPELAIVDRTMTFQYADKRPLKEWVKEVPKDE